MRLRDVGNLCPVCDAPKGTPCDQERHRRRMAEDYGEKGDAQETAGGGAIEGPRAFVMRLKDQRPDLAEQIEKAYQEGLQGIPPDAPPQLELIKPKVNETPDLERPRRAFGYGDED